MAGNARSAILVIDDDFQVAKTLVQVLIGHGFDAWMITDSATAAKAIEARQPDLIILDYDMPKLLGPEVSMQLKSNPQTQDIPIIFLTGMTDEDTRTIATASGAAAFINKPFKESELIQTIRHITDRAK